MRSTGPLERRTRNMFSYENETTEQLLSTITFLIEDTKVMIANGMSKIAAQNEEVVNILIAEVEKRGEN